MPESSSKTAPVLIHLSREATEDIAEFLDHIDDLDAVIQAAGSTEPRASVSGFIAAVADATKKEAGSVRAVIDALLSMKYAQRRYELNNETFIPTFSRSLEAHATLEWRTKHLKRWTDALPKIGAAFASLTDDHPLAVSAKAHSLSYTHQHILNGARIVTDVRPVFDMAGETIVETLILNTLVVTYMDGDDARMITLALDQQDIVALRKQCERAERKMQVAKTALKGLNPAIIPDVDKQ